MLEWQPDDWNGYERDAGDGVLLKVFPAPDGRRCQWQVQDTMGDLGIDGSADSVEQAKRRAERCLLLLVKDGDGQWRLAAGLTEAVAVAHVEAPLGTIRARGLGRGARGGAGGGGVKHHCHRPGCAAACPPAHLMCARHWAMVDRNTQLMVYKTVKDRGPRIDHTWAPWWRWAHRAIAQALPPGERRNKWLAGHEAFADDLEARVPGVEGRDDA